MSPVNTNGLTQTQSLLAMAARIASTFVQTNPTSPKELPELVRSIHQSLLALAEERPLLHASTQGPAVPVKRSVRPDYIICLEDGRKLKMLRRYLKSRYNMSPEEYRTKWGLTADYPMVAPSYAAQRSDFAKKIGLGRGRRKA